MALTRTEFVDEEVTIYADAAKVYDAVVAALGRVGKIKSAEPHFRRVVARLFSRAGRMNAASVTAHVEPVAADQCKIMLNARAQEGLIPQHTAPKALSRLLAELSTPDLPTLPRPSNSAGRLAMPALGSAGEGAPGERQRGSNTRGQGGGGQATGPAFRVKLNSRKR